jgi:hypothetical protein
MIILHVNILNHPILKRLSEWIRKGRSTLNMTQIGLM